MKNSTSDVDQICEMKKYTFDVDQICDMKKMKNKK
jgi:hypothetical protein